MFLFLIFFFLLQGNTITHQSIPSSPYIPPKRPAPVTSTACGDYLGAYNKFIEQNVKKVAQGSTEPDKSFDQQIKKNFENFIKKSTNSEVVKPEKPYYVATRIQNDSVSKSERANVNISNLSTTLPLCSNIKSIKKIVNNKCTTQNQSPLMLSSSYKVLAAPISIVATSIPSATQSNLSNCVSQNLARVTTKNKTVTPTNYNEQLLSNLVKKEMISKYSTPATPCATGTSFNNLQLLYPQTHQNAINPPQSQHSTIQRHSQPQRSKEYRPQQYELQQQTQRKNNTERLQKVPQNQQKYIINTAKRSTEPYATNYSRSKIKVEQPQSASTYKIGTSQDKTLLSEPSAPISELNASFSQAFMYNQLLNLKSNLLQSRLLGVSSEDN